MWGIIIGHFGACWGYYTLFTQMPTYLKDIQHLDIKTVSETVDLIFMMQTIWGNVSLSCISAMVKISLSDI